MEAEPEYGPEGPVGIEADHCRLAIAGSLISGVGSGEECGLANTMSR